MSATMTETEKPLRLPRANEAVIHPDKLKGYALSADHERGREKARVFASALGITQDDWEYLRDQILEAIKEGWVRSIDPRGPGWFEWTVVVSIDGLNGATRPVVTRWTVQAHQPPRLTSCWVDI